MTLRNVVRVRGYDLTLMVLYHRSLKRDIIIEVELYGNGGDKEYSMVIVEWVKIDRAGNLTIKGKMIPDSKSSYQE